MNHKSRIGYTFLVFSCCFAFTLEAQKTTLTGSTYAERGTSMIRCMASTKPVGGDPKYVAPYYFAKLLIGSDTDYVLDQLEKMYQYHIANPAVPSDSPDDFYAHSTIHGYMLTKDKMPLSLRSTIKSFMQIKDYNDTSGTLNMSMMTITSGFICAEEWSDFKDKSGHTSLQLIALNRPRILATLQNFYLLNCPEADAFTYLATDLMYVRMLAEFARDSEVKKAAISAYHHMLSLLLPAWNQGLYSANPPRSKGWSNLYTTNEDTKNSIVQLAWLYFGNPTNSRPMIPSLTVTNNVASLNFWAAYRRTIDPLPVLNELEAAKQFPYVTHSLIDDKDNWKYHKFTYQSKNYGLSTQTIIPYTYSNAQFTYAYKETKNIHLVWQSTDTDAAMFSVCQDNPERPQPYQTVSNIPGYGENPYQRVLQSNRAVIGVYNVPPNYMDNPKFYQLYVPFSNFGIKRRIQKTVGNQKWLFCHTGTMMFAFLCIEPWEYEAAGGKYSIIDHTVLILQDKQRRRGSWILETSEITEQYKDSTGNIINELNSFRDDVVSKVSWETSADYETGAHPMLRYHSLDGDEMELNFFSPNEPYNGQYKINNQPVGLNTTYIVKNSFIEQRLNNDTVYYYSPSGTKTLVRNPISAVAYNHDGEIYHQNFDGLPLKGEYTNGNYSTQGPFELEYLSFTDTAGKTLVPQQMEGWQIFKTVSTGTSGIVADDGSLANASVYGFGLTNSTDRSLGLINTNLIRHAFGVVICNNTRSILTSCNIAFTGEQWRKGASESPQTMMVNYSVLDAAATAAKGINQTSMTLMPECSFVAPVSQGVERMLNGKDAPNRVAIMGSIKDLTWLPGTYLLVRWDTQNMNSDALAIDDFSFEAHHLLNIVPNNIIDDRVKIVPNPARDRATIYTGEEAAVINITTLLGKKVKMIKKDAGLSTQVVDVSKWAKGVYLVNVVRKRNCRVEKLIIEY